MFTFLFISNRSIRTLSLSLALFALSACSDKETLDRSPQFSLESSSLTAASENVAYSAIIQATDIYGDLLSYAIADGPVGLVINAATGELSWTPSVDQIGMHTFTVVVTDTEALSTSQEFQIEVLNVNEAPQFTSLPSITSVVEGNQFRYQAAASDADSASDPQETVNYSLVSGPLGMVIDPLTGQLTWTPSSEQVGPAVVLIRVTDRQGLVAEQTFTVEVTPIISAQIIANPQTGLSPLTVRFSSSVENNNLVITQYDWDFDNDGTIDRSDAFGAPQIFTYTGPPGASFDAQLIVTPASGEPIIATQTITIGNDEPSVTVSADATNGHAPLTVGFTVNASDVHGIDTVEIDFDGDGSYDATQAGNDSPQIQQVFQQTFTEEGSFSAVVRVRDLFGAETVVGHSAITVDVNNPQDPIITLSAAPASGALPLVTTLTANAELFDGGTIARWEWDTDGDGEFETIQQNGETDTIEATYAEPQLYYPVVRAVTDSGRSAIASIEITPQVSGSPALFIGSESDTINVDMGETASITVTLPFATTAELWMEDRNGGRAATAAAAQSLSAGEHTFDWDGTNDQGELLTQADYYAVLRYSAFGENRELDLRDTTGGQLSYLRRDTPNPRRFDRLEGPLRTDYEVTEPAEVTFFWQISFNDRLMTLLERVPLGRGQYSLYWNGEFPNGRKIPEGTFNLLPGVIRYHLPDNVIYVQEAPRITDYQLSSTIVADPRREPIGLELDLSKSTNVELVVSDMDKGVIVATRFYEDLSSGFQAITWDGRNDRDQLLAPGDYRLGVRSIDSTGFRSLFWYRTQRIEY